MSTDTDGMVLLSDAIAHVNRPEAKLALVSEPPCEPCTWIEEFVHAMMGLIDKQRFELCEHALWLVECTRSGRRMAIR